MAISAMPKRKETAMKTKKQERPTLKIIGGSGNAFAILGAAQRAARKAEWPTELWDEYKAKATSGDYDHLLAVTMEYFDVE